MGVAFSSLVPSSVPSSMSSRGNKLLPSLLPILATSNSVLLPGASIVLHVTDPRGISLVENRLWNEDDWRGKYIGVVPREQLTDKLHSVGTAASVSRITARTHPNPHFSLLATGLCRFRLEKVEQEVPYPVGVVTQLDYIPSHNDPLPQELESLADSFRSSAQELLGLLQVHSSSAGKLKQLLDSLPVQSLPDLLTSLVRASFEERLGVLDAVELKERFELAQPMLLRQIETLRLLHNTTLHSPRNHGKNLIRKPVSLEQKRAIERDDDEEDDISELLRRVNAAKLPSPARKAAMKEIKRLKSLPAHFPEHAVSRTYLETLLDLPWTECSEDKLAISEARIQLDADHYGMDKVKKRVIEFLAVRQLKNSLKGPILCLVGAPGVGKTSIGRSVARTMGRKFQRISLGGICDQSDIRGHRRTYIGSMPGRIIQGLRTVQVTNPVFLLDEVDKLNKGVQGDPAAALLEVLDPEQNHSFTDHYLNIPYDLSQVLFIATANTTSTIPPALLDRMEVITLPGYTLEEKVEIAFRHLVPKQMEQHGLTDSQLTLPREALKIIASDYTREAGVRSMERNIGSVCRAVAVKVAENQGSNSLKLPIIATDHTLEGILGPKKFDHDISEQLTHPGVAVGLAWTVMGGEILFVEATKMPGSGELILTGQLGSVMKESARLALNWLRSNASTYGLQCGNMESTDIHIHFPAGAVEKDGPSAGVTITAVLASLFSGRCVRSDTAMTGEVTLRGSVLPVGGIKEKVLAAHRAGISRVLLPERNKKDLLELPDAVKEAIMFILIERVGQVLENAFDGGLTPLSKL